MAVLSSINLLYLTDADIGCDAADIDVSAALVSDELLQAGLAELGVVKEGGVGVDGGVDPLVDHPGLGMHLELLVKLRPPGVLHAVTRPQNLQSWNKMLKDGAFFIWS